MKLEESFYRRKNVTEVARGLLGKVLLTRIGGVVTSGVIVETEAYSYIEKGCHAYRNRMTARNRVMFNVGGHAYVYLCYGIHNLFNVVTNSKGLGDAVLIRALEPSEGLDIMLERADSQRPERLTSGPGKLTKALGIDRSFNGKNLAGRDVWIEKNGHTLSSRLIASSPRIGIDYAGKDAKLPWRFTLKGNPWISKI